MRELEDEDEEGEWEFEDPEEGLVGDEDQVAMVVTSKSSSTEGATTSNSEPVVHSVTHPLEYLLSTQAWERISRPIGLSIQVPLVTLLLRNG